MLFSMTGFGEAHSETDACRIAFRIKAVNHKSLDLQLKLPSEFSYFEAEFRRIAKQKVFRGRIDVAHEFDILDPELKPPINLDRMKLSQIVKMAQWLKEEPEIGGVLDVNTLVKLPELMVEKRLGYQFPKEVETVILDTFSLALDRLCISRNKEGSFLLTDLNQRVATVERGVETIADLAHSRRESLRDLIIKRVEALKPEIQFDPSRLAQEVVFYADRLDISEEITRLKAHVQTMKTRLNEEKQPKGRALEFLLQEMFREVTTIGNKVKLLDAANVVVTLKTECEKMKEQIFNVE